MNSEQPPNSAYHITSLSWLNSLSLPWLNSLAWPTKSLVNFYCWYQHLSLSPHLLCYTLQYWWLQACHAFFYLQAFVHLFPLEYSSIQYAPPPMSEHRYTHTHTYIHFHFYPPSDLGIDKWFSKCGPWQAASASTGNLLKKKKKNSQTPTQN